jgi:hypothetical protein
MEQINAFRYPLTFRILFQTKYKYPLIERLVETYGNPVRYRQCFSNNLLLVEFDTISFKALAIMPEKERAEFLLMNMDELTAGMKLEDVFATATEQEDSFEILNILLS